MATLHPALTPGVSAQTLALAFRELAALLGAGLRLDDSLEMAAAMGPAHFRQALQGLAAYVRAGHPLSEGMRSYGALFHPVIPAVVGTGEHTGNLDRSFALLADFFEAEAELKRVVQSATVYPIVVVITAILVVGVLSYINFMPSTWAVRLLWAVGIGISLWLLLRFRTVQVLARYVVMLIPFFGGIMQQLAVARFCQTLGLLVRAGVPYLEGLQTSMAVAQHPAVEQAARHVYAGVRNGVPLEESIRSQRSFPHIVTALVGTGEMAGTVDDSLLAAAKFLREDAEYKVKNSAKLAGPLMTIFAAIIVLLILSEFWKSYFRAIFGVLEE